MSLPAGWYPVAGDPQGTKRYWDGVDFTSKPTRDPNVSAYSKKRSAAQKWQLASPYARLVAWIVDYLAPIVVFVGIARATGFGVPDPGASEYADYRNLLLVWCAFALINQILFLGYWGTTLGKTMVGLRVVCANDSAKYPGLARAIIRAVTTVPTFLISGVLLFLGKRRTFNDLLAGTAVVYT